MPGTNFNAQLDEVIRERDQLRERYSQAMLIIKTQQNVIKKMVNDFKTTFESVDQLEKRCSDLVVKFANLRIEGIPTCDETVHATNVSVNAASGSEQEIAESEAKAIKKSGGRPEGEDDNIGPRDI
ncbi:hypothetical protein L5515_018697 [Caenorhabditis briggsae]|uniref:Uncharacterized protein n=1 Tax=Caenorhabditis briggsae TaxID=6238 RepID=A0AAE9FMS5_CAEBR|nr:hypothetical protein L5515_018697 [Caenorhabditis briggsae]